ncbi:DUF6538 domain-containing protein [Silvimonas iriomotensis]|uniref:Integrase n=1 Tax=Silvimonas iriomotensis TaxID=449662 RepID=A0ABQ2PA53_9NEIS|nr:DUF6538 domain-containing protein [Silvimonas iriomotensis]GGP21872.1 integrase [Silvimonas iriomotensis]
MTSATLPEHTFRRGALGTIYFRRRIPIELLPTYPENQTHIVCSLHTSDLREAKIRRNVEASRVDAEFQAKRNQLTLTMASQNTKRIYRLPPEQAQEIAAFWSQQVLLGDEQRRKDGMDDEEFDEINIQLEETLASLRRMLAQGNSMNVMPVLQSFSSMCGLELAIKEENAQHSAYIFLRTMVKTLELQLERQRGQIVDADEATAKARHPLLVAAPERAGQDVQQPSWELVFDAWREHVEARPKSTTIASQTPWRSLCKSVKAKGINLPGEVTARHMTEFVQQMRDAGLAVKTINERISKIRAIYRIAVGKHLLTHNPAAQTIGFKESSVNKRRKRRLSLDENDLTMLFGSGIFTQHLRSRGQSAEASYWIPLLMLYTGARPEEIAGLAISDIRHDNNSGWHFNIIDRPCKEDMDLFETNTREKAIPDSHRRTLKNAPSTRKIPVAQQLIDLGLLRYIEWRKERHESVLFPELTKDWHGKLSGAFSKFFGRYKKTVGIKDPRKVLYSLRHTMKDLLELAECPRPYLRRVLGHTIGDGAITDNYGSDLPLSLMAEHFAVIRFPAIPAEPWQPGKGYISLKM